MKRLREVVRVRGIASVLVGVFAACGLVGCDGGLSLVSLLFLVEETYTVNTPGQWDIVSSNGSKGYISFVQDGSGLYFSGYNTGGAAAAGFTSFCTQCCLRYPVQIGDSWSGSGLSGGYMVSSVTVVQNVAAEVTVPAGTFSCVETIETTTVPSGYGGHICEYKRYFARGVGLVKVVNTDSSGLVTSAELQSYSVPNANSNDYFPLNVGSTWTFKWD